MRYIWPLILLVSPVSAQGVETRCGWFSNPTPANYELEDADGYWTLSAQGQGEARGFYDATEAAGPRGEWVLMSPAGYGYGCACVNGDFGPIGSAEVREVFSMRRLPLAQCASDPALADRDLKPLWEGEG